MTVCPYAAVVTGFGSGFGSGSPDCAIGTSTSFTIAARGTTSAVGVDTAVAARFVSSRLVSFRAKSSARSSSSTRRSEPARTPSLRRAAISISIEVEVGVSEPGLSFPGSSCAT